MTTEAMIRAAHRWVSRQQDASGCEDRCACGTPYSAKIEACPTMLQELSEHAHEVERMDGEGPGR